MATVSSTRRGSASSGAQDLEFTQDRIDWHDSHRPRGAHAADVRAVRCGPSRAGCGPSALPPHEGGTAPGYVAAGSRASLWSKVSSNTDELTRDRFAADVLVARQLVAGKESELFADYSQRLRSRAGSSARRAAFPAQEQPSRAPRASRSDAGSHLLPGDHADDVTHDFASCGEEEGLRQSGDSPSARHPV